MRASGRVIFVLRFTRLTGDEDPLGFPLTLHPVVFLLLYAKNDHRRVRVFPSSSAVLYRRTAVCLCCVWGKEAELFSRLPGRVWLLLVPPLGRGWRPAPPKFVVATALLFVDSVVVW